MSMNLLIVGGGTGGHISPGVALYEKFRERGIRAYFLAGSSDIRFSSLKDVGPDDLYLYRAYSFSKNILKMPFFAFGFAWSVIKAVRLIRKLKINAIIGMGGYVSAPALISAVIMRISIYLCEQNSIPGKVTNFFSKRAKIIFITFAASEEYFKNGFRVSQLGNPIRGSVLTDTGRDEARARFNLSHCKSVILAIGGSQGAVKINELILGLKEKFSDKFRDIGLIWGTGDFSFKIFKDAVQGDALNGSIFISPYINDVGLAYRASDIVISRAGAGVMMEIASMGLPSILIPYPFAAMNHQDKNADEFVDAGASIKFSNDEALSENIGPVLFELLNSRIRLDKMAGNTELVSKPNASEDIVNAIIDDIG